MFTIATWNVNSINTRLPHVTKWLLEYQPDVLAIQETKTLDSNFPSQAFHDINYQVIYAGQKAYNGVAIVSRVPVAEIVTSLPDFEDEQKRIIAATVADIRLINIYVPNGQMVGSDKYQYKLRWLNALQRYLQQQLTQYKKLLLVGDYNIAPEDRDVYDPKALEGQVLVSPLERQAFFSLLECGLCDTFRLFEHEKVIYSWWDYRALAMQFNRGLRIDHILANTALSAQCVSCSIDKSPRKWPQPSDHAPVIAKFDIT